MGDFVNKNISSESQHKPHYAASLWENAESQKMHDANIPDKNSFICDFILSSAENTTHELNTTLTQWLEWIGEARLKR